MAWYVGKDGQQRWIPKDDSVYTVIQPADKLPIEDLSYLVKTSTKAVFQEHLVDEDLDCKRGSGRQKARTSGRQRGYVVRVHQEEQLRVVPFFKESTVKLMNCGLVSRVDTDDAVNMAKRKKKVTAGDEISLGVNECRIETTSRIHHFAHGPGFRVEVAEGNIMQRIHFFTSKREIAGKEWHKALVAALESTGAFVMLARRTADAAEKAIKDGDEGIEQISSLRMDEAQKEDADWLQSLMQMKPDEQDSESSEDDGPAPVQPAAKAEARPTSQTAATSTGDVPEWRRRNADQAPAESSRPDDPSVRKQPAVSSRPGDPSIRKQPAVSSRPGDPSVRKQPAVSSRAGDPSIKKQAQPKQQPQKNGRQQEQDPAQRPAQPTEKQGGWWQGKEQSWEPQLWREPAKQKQWSESPPPYAPPTRNKDQWGEWSDSRSYYEAPARPQAKQCSAPVKDFFAKAAKAEKKQSSNGKGQELMDMLVKCAECGRGKPLKLWQDPDDDQWYCRVCWVNFYERDPPDKP